MAESVDALDLALIRLAIANGSVPQEEDPNRIARLVRRELLSPALDAEARFVATGNARALARKNEEG